MSLMLSSLDRCESSTRKRVTIVGAGIGGLAAAIRLARAGAMVTVIEKNDGPGGRCGRIEANGYAFDMGPTILLVPSVLEELFAHAGRKLRDYLDYAPTEPNYRIHYRDGSSLTLSRDAEFMRGELERIEPGSFARYQEFLAAGAEQMHAAMSRFAVTHYGSLREFVTPAVVRDLFRARAFRSVAGHVGSFFRDERLRMALSFQTMYLGLSPYDAPAIYTLLPYTEIHDGVFYVRGGLYQIPLALERLARELGVRFEYGRAVTLLVPRGDRIAEIVLDGHERRSCDVVLANADLPWVYENLLSDRKLPRAKSLEYTSSGFMLYLGVNRRYERLMHHNVFFGDRFRQSFDDIFDSRVVPADAHFYVAAPSETDTSIAPPGCTAMYVLVPVPHQNARVDWSRSEEPIRARVLDRLEATVCPDLRRHIVVERRINPDGWARMFNLQNGAAFGLSHTITQVGALRPKNRDAQFGNLYFCGASTQPGTGIPLVTISAKLASERMIVEQSIRATPVESVREAHRVEASP